MPTLNALKQWVFTDNENVYHRYDFSYKGVDVAREYRYNGNLDTWIPMPSYLCVIGDIVIVESTKAKMKESIIKVLEGKA